MEFSMNRKILVGGLVTAIIAMPALAQMGDRDRPDRNAPITRADAEARVKDRFATLDLNKDGIVSQDEARQARETRRDERRDRRFAMFDADKNGSISRAEFEAAADARVDRPSRRHKMRRGGMEGGLFARADANNDGRVTLNEAMAPALERFDRVDVNRDGTITPEERREARQKFREEWRAKRNDG